MFVFSLDHPVPWTRVFGDDRPVEIEIGPGRGERVLAAAAARPTVNFFAIELRAHRPALRMERARFTLARGADRAAAVEAEVDLARRRRLAIDLERLGAIQRLVGVRERAQPHDRAHHSEARHPMIREPSS